MYPQNNSAGETCREDETGAQQPCLRARSAVPRLRGRPRGGPRDPASRPRQPRTRPILRKGGRAPKLFFISLLRPHRNRGRSATQIAKPAESWPDLLRRMGTLATRPFRCRPPASLAPGTPEEAVSARTAEGAKAGARKSRGPRTSWFWAGTMQKGRVVGIRRQRSSAAPEAGTGLRRPVGQP